MGAMSATWYPFSMARIAAWMATIVLPEPTSPCSKPVHGPRRAHVVGDFFQHALLRRRGVEGQNFA